MGKLLSAKQVAEHMSVTKQTVFDWISKGMLPAIKVGKTVRIKEEDFNGFLNSYYQGSGNKTEENKT